MSNLGIAETVSNLPTSADLPSASAIKPEWNLSRHAIAGKTLNAAVAFWFAVAIIGQAFLVAYILSFYGGAVLAGDLAKVNKVLAAGYMRGDLIGNVALAVHLVIAAIITLGGPLQLIAQIRTSFPMFHRWNGRIYLSIAVITSIAGTYMVWTRPVVGDIAQHIGTTSNAVVIVLCAAQTLRFALASQFAVHRRWALRLYLAVSGVWFFRVALMFSLLLNKGPFGFDPDTFTGPFLSVLAFAQYLAPLAVLEVYLRARDGRHAAAKFATAIGLFVLSIAMGAGIFGAALMMWLPHI